MKTKMTVAEYVSAQIEASGKSQIEIAREMGYDRPNVVSMFKKGQTKLPINKVSAFARAVGVDPAFLLRLVMSEYLPGTWESMKEIEGGMPITHNERLIVEKIRELSGNTDPKLQSPAQQRALKAFVDSMVK